MRAPPTLDDPPLVIRQARWKGALLAAGCAAFVAVGMAMQSDVEARAAGQLCVLLFGAGALIGLALLVSPGTLVLAPEGLSQTVLWRTRRWAWADVSSFREWRFRRTRLITFDDAKASHGALQQANAALGAGSGSLSAQWAISTPALLALLAQAKARWG